MIRGNGIVVRYTSLYQTWSTAESAEPETLSSAGFVQAVGVRNIIQETAFILRYETSRIQRSEWCHIFMPAERRTV
jgi:hypothetical protein